MKYSAIINDLIFKDIISKTELMKIDVALKYYLLNHFSLYFISLEEK